jgi:hypothetical protein
MTPLFSVSSVDLRVLRAPFLRAPAANGFQLQFPATFAKSTVWDNGDVDHRKPSDESLAAEISRRCREAKARLAQLMAEHGLKAADGWTILEDLRSRPEYTEYIFRPIHLRLPAPPPDLKTSVAIDFEGRPVEVREEY